MWPAMWALSFLKTPTVDGRSPAICQIIVQHTTGCAYQNTKCCIVMYCFDHLVTATHLHALKMTHFHLMNLRFIFATFDLRLFVQCDGLEPSLCNKQRMSFEITSSLQVVQPREPFREDRLSIDLFVSLCFTFFGQNLDTFSILKRAFSHGVGQPACLP